jgi:alginate O-acetyltransferase complex protein AlgI
MTLSRFLRDYLYIPLGGNRKGVLRRYLNLFITMLLGGLWHGAGWTFVVWGALHGTFLTINHLWREAIAGRVMRGVPDWICALSGGIITFIAVVAAWVVFRSSDISQARIMLEAMFGINARPISLEAVLHGQLLLTTDLSGRDLIKLLVLSLAWVWLLPNSSKLKFIQGNVLLALLQAVAVVYFLCLAIDQFGSYSPFLYFQF